MITPDVYGNGIPETELSDILSAEAMIDGIDIELALSWISGRQNVLRAR